LKADVAREHERRADKILDKAKSSDRKKKYLDAWQLCREAETYTLSSVAAPQATAFRDALEKDADRGDDLKKEADKKLKSDVKKAEGTVKYRRYQDAIDILTPLIPT
jgi:hypothetical protein